MILGLSLSFFLGAVLGSFAKAIADRSLGQRSFWGRSYCERCKTNLPWYDLLPVISYIFLQGKCRYCRKKISIEYLLMEVGMGLLIGFLFWHSFQNLPNLISNIPFLFFLSHLSFKIFFITVLLIIFLTDIKKMLIPDRVVIPAIWISLGYLVAVTLIEIGYLYYYLFQSTLGKLLLPPHTDYFQRHALITAEPLFWGILMGILIGGFFWGLIIITKGKGMGGGDVKLGALMGLALGFPLSLVALITAFLSGAILSLLLIFTGKKNFKSSIPFGPFLVFGSLIALFFGSQIIDWYLTINVISGNN